MAASTPITTLLQTAAEPIEDQLGVTDAELVERNRALNEEVTRLRVLELKNMADMDPLLPLYNRRAFMQEVEPDSPCWIAMG